MAKVRKRAKPKRFPPLRDFEAWAELMRHESKGAAGSKVEGGHLLRREAPKNVFRITAYRYRRRLERAKMIDALKAHIRKRDKDRWDGHGDTPALWVLRLIALPKETEAVRKARSRLAAALELAALNDVRPQLLLGFLYEVGPSAVTEEHAAMNKQYVWAKYYRKPDPYEDWDDDTGNQSGSWT